MVIIKEQGIIQQIVHGNIFDKYTQHSTAVHCVTIQTDPFFPRYNITDRDKECIWLISRYMILKQGIYGKFKHEHKVLPTITMKLSFKWQGPKYNLTTHLCCNIFIKYSKSIQQKTQYKSTNTISNI